MANPRTTSNSSSVRRRFCFTVVFSATQLFDHCSRMSLDREFDECIQRIRQGDQDAARELVEKYEPFVRRAARSRLRSKWLRRMFDSVDICQSVLASLFIRTARGEFTLEHPEQLQKLLVRMVRNKVADAWRRHAAHILQDEQHDLNQIPAPASDPAEPLIAAEITTLVRTHLAVEDFEIYELRNSGRTWKEIGALEGVTPEVARKRLSRALQAVALQLEDSEDDK